MLFAVILTSCNKEELVDFTNDETSEITQLVATDTDDATTTTFDDAFARRAAGGGQEPCFSFNYPIAVVYPDGTTAMATDKDSLRTLFRDFRDSQEEDSEEELTLQYPLDVTLEDGTVMTLNNETMLDALKEECRANDDDDNDGNGNGHGHGHGHGDGHHGNDGRGNDCFDINFPIMVVYPDGSTTMATDKDSLRTLFRDFRDTQEEDSEEELMIQFPIDVTLADSTVVTLNSAEELEALKDECQEDDDEDDCNGDCDDDHDGRGDDCFDLNFPVSVVYPDGTTATAEDKRDLRNLYRDFNESQEEDSEEELEFQYPIDVTLEDGTVMTLNNETMLEALIESCEEDDGEE